MLLDFRLSRLRPTGDCRLPKGDTFEVGVCKGTTQFRGEDRVQPGTVLAQFHQ